VTGEEDTLGAVDFEALFDEAVDELSQESRVDEEAEQGSEDPGPDEESGELDVEDDSTVADSGEERALPDVDEEDDDDELEELDDADQDDDGEGEQEPDPKLLELQAELERVKRDAAAREQKLLELIGGRKEAPKQPQQSPREAALREAWTASWTEPERLKEFPEDVQKEVARLGRLYQRDQARYALDPRAEFTEKFGPVLREILDRELGQIREFVNAQRRQAVTAPYEAELSDPTVRERLIHILADVPGSDDPTEAVQKQRLATAVRIYRAESRATQTAAREQKLRTTERREKARKRSRRGTRGGKPRKGKKVAPTLDNPEDIESFAQALLDDPDLLNLME